MRKLLRPFSRLLLCTLLNGKRFRLLHCCTCHPEGCYILGTCSGRTYDPGWASSRIYDPCIRTGSAANGIKNLVVSTRLLQTQQGCVQCEPGDSYFHFEQ